MTPFVPFADGVQAYLHFSYYGLPISNRLWFLNRFETPTPTTIDEAAVGLADWATDWLVPFLGSDLEFLGTSVADWSASPPPYTSVEPRSQFGGASTESHSANVSYRVLLKGSSAQTFKNNSQFVPGVPLGEVVGNTVSSVFRDAVFEAYVALIDAAGGWSAGNLWRWVVASSWLDGILRPELAFARTDFILVTDLYVTQRRRRLGVV